MGSKIILPPLSAESVLRMQLTAQVLSGLLASGHYTAIGDDGTPGPFYSDDDDCAKAVMHARFMVSEMLNEEEERLAGAKWLLESQEGQAVS